ncbi:MAG: branched-chain amino acid ABC transporter permease [Nitrososphaeria archaeon]|nr:branched-chain amino acid ABC transporter permease [Nitrososphaeria archaeon]NIQ34164.1 branched-chain amino acid ABC transporter permease [Nitrososphaeria archaeon]
MKITEKISLKSYHLLLSIILIYLVIAPATGPLYHILIIFLLKAVILAQSINIIAGYTGYVDFGHVAFFGIGTYVMAVLTRNFGVNPFIAVVAAGAGAIVLAAAIGAPTLRLRGAYFAIATLSLNQTMMIIVLNLPDEWMGGAIGIPNPPIYNPLISYYLMFILTVAIILTTYLIRESKFGVGLVAIREDEDAAAAMGLNTTYYKLTAFIISALFAGLAGGIDYWFMTYTQPPDAFNIFISVRMIIMAMLGGFGTVIGPIIGAIILYIVEYYLWATQPQLYLMILGALIVGIVMFMPEGIIGLLKRIFPQYRTRKF